MIVRTSNKLGKIALTEVAIATIASQAASECYGVIDLSLVRFTDRIAQLFNKTIIGRGVEVEFVENKICIDVYVALKAGVNVNTVKQCIADEVKYRVESFTNMRVDKIVVHVTGQVID